jgi:hypothetical protein
VSWPRRVVEAWAARTFEHPFSVRWGGWGSHVDPDGLPKRRTFYGPHAERKAAVDIRRAYRPAADPRAEPTDLVRSAT